MNIQIVSCLTKNCGIGRYTHELASGLYDLGEDVHVFRKGGGDEPFIDNYPYRSLRSLRNYVAPLYLSKAIRGRESDIWHADYVDSSFALYLAKKKSPIVTTVHDAIPFRYYKGIKLSHYRYILSKAFNISEKSIVVSKKSKEDLVHYTGVAPEKIEVVYNGINHDVFFPDNVKRRNAVFTIRYLGGLGAKHKNAHLLIEVAHILSKRGVICNWEIGGASPESTPLPALAREFGLKNVRFVGFVPDAEQRDFLAGADAFLYPSGYEGFGFPPLEAMACGTPTVASNAGSLEEVLKDGALLSEPLAEALAENLLHLMNNSQLYELMSRKAIEVASQYTWKCAVEKTLKIYKQIV